MEGSERWVGVDESINIENTFLDGTECSAKNFQWGRMSLTSQIYFFATIKDELNRQERINGTALVHAQGFPHGRNRMTLGRYEGRQPSIYSG
jgi:hypothetical protein